MKIFKFKDEDNRDVFKAILGLATWIIILALVSWIIAIFKE